MARSTSETDKAPERYSSVFAFVYIFNLIIGVGALSLPQSFSDAGIALGTILLIVLACMSYMTATFMVEAMAAANAYVRHKARVKKTVVEADVGIQGPVKNDVNYSYDSDESGRYSPSKSRKSPSPRPVSRTDENTPLVPPIMAEDDVESSDDDNNPNLPNSLTSSGKYILPADDYEIDQKFEMGAIANMFYHPIGIVLYYITICLYLYGDLAIYAVAIPKSVVVVVCTKPPNMTNGTDTYDNQTGKFDKDAICFGSITQLEAYYIFLAITCLMLCPWTFFNLTKSKYIQLFTTILRNIAFILMVALAIVKLAEGQSGSPSTASIAGFPTLFGVSIYSFMCQHSLPGMITPMRNKRRIFVLMFVDFALILSFYLLLSYTGAYTFPLKQLNDIYTLNFFTRFSKLVPVGDQVIAVLGYYLALFPVFTLSTNFPIISITLRENLKALVLILFKHCRGGEEPFHWAINRFVFPLLALVPAIALAFATTNVQLLVSVTGSFPGIGVQYVIPATLAFAGKYIITKKLNLEYKNKYKSPFSFSFFLVLVLVWTGVSVVLIVTEDVIKLVNGTFL